MLHHEIINTGTLENGLGTCGRLPWNEYICPATMIDSQLLERLYLQDGSSMMDISLKLGCSVHKVTYWMGRHGIKRRSISEAVYQKHNPDGDPFTIKPIKTRTDAKLLGLGLGLYWGEGTKANKHSVRLGNTDPELIKAFMKFLIELFGVKKEKLHFSLQIFSDTDPQEALNFWLRELEVEASQFGKIVVTISGSIGTYRHKNTRGVVTVHFHNKKLRDIIVGMLPK